MTGALSLLEPSAGRENRTPVSSLARTYSTTKPYPQFVYAIELSYTIIEYFSTKFD